MCKQTKIKNSFSNCPEQAGVQLCPVKQGFNMSNSLLGRQKLSLQVPLPSSFFPALTVEPDIMWDIPLVSQGQLSHLCLLPSLLVPPPQSTSSGSRVRKRKKIHTLNGFYWRGEALWEVETALMLCSCWAVAKALLN